MVLFFWVSKLRPCTTKTAVNTVDSVSSHVCLDVPMVQYLPHIETPMAVETEPNK